MCSCSPDKDELGDTGKNFGLITCQLVAAIPIAKTIKVAVKVKTMNLTITVRRCRASMSRVYSPSSTASARKGFFKTHGAFGGAKLNTGLRIDLSVSGRTCGLKPGERLQRTAPMAIARP